MANLKQTSITGSSGTTSLLVSGSSILMPGMSGSVDSGSAAQVYIDFTPRNRGLKMHLSQAGSFGSQSSPYSCLGAWSTATNYPIDIQASIGFGKSINAVGMAGGYCGSSKTATYLWNGSTWSSTGALNNARYAAAGGGSQNAGLVTMGYIAAPSCAVTCTEEFDGTTWTAGGASPSGRRKVAGAGEQNGFFATGGDTIPAAVATTDEYNGSSWASGGSLIQSRAFACAVGTVPSGLVAGGSSNAVNPIALLNNVEEYNGVAWSVSTGMIKANYLRMMSGNSSDSAVIYGGYIAPVYQKDTEEWSGITWSMSNNMINGTSIAGGSAGVPLTQGGLSVGGSPGYKTTVEAYEKTFTLPFTFGSAVSTDSWSGGPLMLINRNGMGSAGTQNAALGFGGYRAPTGTAGVTCNEEFNGTAWSAGGALSIARYAIGGFGTQNAAAAAGGQTPTRLTATEEYNGTSWSPGGAMINARGRYGAAGTQNAGLAVGGYGTPGTSISNTEEYDGSAWTNGGALISSVYSQGATGTQNAGLSFLGANIPSGNTNKTEEYDGSTWATAATANVTRNDISAGFGTQNATIATTGYVSPTGTTCTEFYNGTSWSIYPASLTIGTNVSAAGDTDEGLIFGGNSYSIYAGRMTQFWNANTPTCSTTPFCLAAWSLGKNTINSYCSSGAAGTGNAAVAFGGGGPNNPGSATNLYNGTTWSSVNSLITARNCIGGTGTSTAALGIGGILSPAITTCNEEWDGTNWSTGGPLITQRVYPGTAGTQNAGLMFGGEANNVGTTCTEEYNGTAWATGTALIAASAFQAGTGTQNAAIKMGGGHGGSSSTTENYDGSSWATGGTMNTARYMLGGAGTQTDAWALAGYSVKTCVENYNGITWNNFQGLQIGTDINSGTGGASSTNIMSIGGSATTSGTQKLDYATYCPGVWSAGPAMIIASQGYSGRAGIQTSFATVAASGDQDSHENYNGTSWSLHTCYTTPGRSLAGAGADADNTVFFGGFPGHANTNEWNGSAWSATGNLITALYYNTGAGTQDSAGTVMGYNGSYRSCHENYNGSTWSTATNSPIVMQLPGAGGSSADSHGYAGGGDYTEGIAASGTMAIWNGSAWAEGTSLNTNRYANAGNGTVNAWLVFGGECSSAPYPPQQNTEEFDGTAWSIKGNMMIGGAFGYAGGSGGTAAAGIGAGRYALPGGNNSNTEEWNVCNAVNQGLYCCLNSL
jgi:hypothetical protein